MILLGRILEKRDPSRYDSAEKFILDGVQIYDGLRMKPFTAQAYMFLGGFYADTGQKDKSNEYLKKAEGMFIEMGMDYWLNKTQEVLDRL